MKIRNKTWFSLVISMMLVIVIVLMAIVVLEIAIPFSRNIKWIENSSNAYYQANSWVEWAMFDISTKDVWYDKTFDDTNYNSKSMIYKYKIDAKWKISPVAWKWDSDFDPNWSKVSQWSPIQMEVWNWVLNWVNPKIYFRVPNFWFTSQAKNLTLKWWSDFHIVNWQISSANETLNASGDTSYLNADKVCTSEDIWATDCINWSNYLIFNSSLKWIDLLWNEHDVVTFYHDNCLTSSCTLKLSIINKLQLANINNFPTSLPYLEWRADFWSPSVPTRTADIESFWKSYGFRKQINVSVPQKTLIDSFDFTVFQ